MGTSILIRLDGKGSGCRPLPLRSMPERYRKGEPTTGKGSGALIGRAGCGLPDQSFRWPTKTPVVNMMFRDFHLERTGQQVVLRDRPQPRLLQSTGSYVGLAFR
jgi:hypothetical protein